MNECKVKPTKFQPSSEEFKCPRCGSKAGYFCIDESECDYDCPKLHEKDYIKCYGTIDDELCDYDTNGKAFVAKLLKQKNLVDCEHCKGTGKVKKS